MISIENKNTGVIEFFQFLNEWSNVDEDHYLHDVLHSLIKTEDDVQRFIELYDGDHECLDRTVNKLLRLH